MNNPYFLDMHRRALAGTMYGTNGLVKVDVVDDEVKYILNTTGKMFPSMEEAFLEVAKTGATTFARITDSLETSSENLRGLGGWRSRLKEIRIQLSADTDLAKSLGVTDPSKLFFEVGSFKMPMGKKQTTKSVVDQIASGLIIPDDGAFNVIRMFEGTYGQNPVELSLDQISRILMATSGGAGGFIGTNELIKGLNAVDEFGRPIAADKIGSLFQKLGKRLKGFTALKDVSLAGDDLADMLSGFGVGGIKSKVLDESNVRVFNVAEELGLVARYMVSQGIVDQADTLTDDVLKQAFSIERLRGLDRYANYSEQQLSRISSELLDFYTGNGAITSLAEKIKNSKITSMADFSIAEKANLLEGKIKASYDGTSVINSRFINTMKNLMQKELDELSKGVADGSVGMEALARISELESQLQNLRSGNLEAITGRVSMNLMEGNNIVSRTIKAVFDSAGFRPSLKDYAILTTDVALKKEAAMMGQQSAINLVLQGEPSSLVYQDPLMPAFHYGLFDKDFEKAQEARTARIMQDYRAAVETGEIKQSLRRQIFKDAGMDIDGLPAVVRNQRARQRLFAQKLREAIESGTDVRTMPVLLNYLKAHTESQLQRFKDGMFQPALEDTFRFALDTEESFYAGRAAKGTQGARLGAGFVDITFKSLSGEDTTLQAVNFQIQGHKMLFGGDAASIFKHSLGGFDLDDKGIVMPRIFKDAGGKERLGSFIFRQPTGEAEFIFGKTNFGNVDTISAFLGENDYFGNAIDDLIKSTKTDTVEYKAYNILRDVLGGEKRQGIEERIQRIISTDPLDIATKVSGGQSAIEDAIIEVMKKASESGMYQYQTIDLARLFASRKSGDPAAGIALTKDVLDRLISSGVSTKEEKFLVEQYRDGVIRRAFIEEGAFGVDDSFRASIKNAVGESIYNSQLLGKQTSNEFLGELGRIMEAANMSNQRQLLTNIQAAIEVTYGNKARDAVKFSDSIGTYINRLTIAAAGTNQMQDILNASNLSAAAKKAITDRMTLAIAPSDVVDLIVNLGGNEGVGLERSAEVMRAFFENQYDREAAARAIAKITGLTEEKGISLVNAVGQQMIENKGALMADLRLTSLLNMSDSVSEAERKSLIAGIDQEILRQRLSGEDVSNFIGSFQRQYRESLIQRGLYDPRTGKFSTGVSQQILDDYNTVSSLGKGSYAQQQENLIAYLGLGEDSAYAPLSKAARQGRLAKEAVDAETGRLLSKTQTAFASEINMSADASQIADNILQRYATLLSDNESQLSSILGESEAVNEIFKGQKRLALMNIHDEIYALMHAAAANNAGVTMADIVDNMDFLTSSRYTHLRRIMNGVGFGQTENVLIDLFQGANDARRLKAMNKRGLTEQLLDQYDEMISVMKSSEETKNLLMDNFVRNIERIKTLQTDGKLSSELVSQAAAIYQFNYRGTEDFTALGLGAKDTQMIRNLIAASEARRRLDETGIGELLSFAKGGDAGDFAPTRILSSEDIDAATLVGDSAPELKNTATYKRITESWREGQLGEAFKNPVIRKSAYAALALVGASFIYQARKDRTQDEMTGPPLLPGGSAYEGMPQRQPQIPQPSMFSGYNQGTSYQINIEGSQEQIDSFSSVTGGSVNSTIYKGLPQLGRDPYSLLAGSF